MKSINKKYFSIRSIYLLIIDLPQVDRYEMRDIIYYELDIIIWQPGHHLLALRTEVGQVQSG